MCGNVDQKRFDLKWIFIIFIIILVLTEARLIKMRIDYITEINYLKEAISVGKYGPKEVMEDKIHIYNIINKDIMFTEKYIFILFLIGASFIVLLKKRRVDQYCSPDILPQ
jgi:hypothetical protein